MYCRHCGKEIQDTDRFCFHCGGALNLPLNEAQKQTPPSQIQPDATISAPTVNENNFAYFPPAQNFYAPPTQSYYVEQPATVQAELTPREREEKKSRASTILALGIVSLALSMFSLIVFSVGISLLSDDFYSAFLGVTLGCAIINLPALVLGIISRCKANRFLRYYGECTPKSRTGSHLANAGRIMATVLIPFLSTFFFFY